MRICTGCGHILSDKFPNDVCWSKLHKASHFNFLSPLQLLNNMRFFSSSSFTGASQPLRQLMYEGKFVATEEELDRKSLMSLVPKKRGETIEKQIKESKDPRSY